MNKLLKFAFTKWPGALPQSIELNKIKLYKLHAFYYTVIMTMIFKNENNSNL